MSATTAKCRYLSLAVWLLSVSCHSPSKPPAATASHEAARPSEPPPANERAPARARLNLILVTIDTLRSDRVGCYGYSAVETPSLDGLAQRGALFENAVTHTPLTAPSHGSIFTGLYPMAHKVRDTGGFILDPSHTTLAAILERTFQWSLASGEESALAYNGLGLVSVQKEDVAAARGYFEKAVHRDPELLEARLNLGRAYKILGDIPRARACFEAFLAKAPPAQYGQIIAKLRQELATMR